MWEHENPLKNLAENLELFGLETELTNQETLLCIRDEGEIMAFMDLEGRERYSGIAIKRNDITMNRIKHCFMRFKEGRYCKGWELDFNGVTEMGYY